MMTPYFNPSPGALARIMDTLLLQQMLEEGYVRMQHHPDDADLVIFNYTEKAQFDRVWNEVTLQCRGLIVRRHEGIESMVVARPFAKFFNYGENGRETYDFEAEVEVTDKMDGSLGILYMAPDGMPAIATRGSFASDQALHATKVYRDRYEGTWMPMMDRYTYLFEIIFPENRIVVDYGARDDLVAIGIVRKETGRIFGPDYAHYLDGWTGPVTSVFEETTLSSALRRKPREGAEGVVVRFRASNEMVKIKQEDYVALHRIIFGLNERSIWQMTLDGKTGDDIKEGLPEEFHPWVDKVVDRIWKEYYEISDSAFKEFDSLVNILNDEYPLQEGSSVERKKFLASMVVSSKNSGMLFLLYDGKNIRETIFKKIRPESVLYKKEA